MKHEPAANIHPALKTARFGPEEKLAAEPRWLAAAAGAPRMAASREPALPTKTSLSVAPNNKEPRIDVSPKVSRIPLQPPDSHGLLHWPSVTLSLVIHGAVLALTVFGIGLDFLRPPEDFAVVEVTFGVEVPSRVRAAPPKKPDPNSEVPPEPEQGTKLPEQLPQLPERFDINTKVPEAAKDDMPLPEALKADAPPQTPPPTAPTPPPQTPDPKAIVAPERDKDARKLDINEVIERMKREDRKVADKEKEGVNKIPDSPFAKPSDLPPNPLAEKPLPNMPDSLAPSGSLAGRKLAGSALEAYRTAALVHMKRNWNIPGVYEFPSELEAVAVVVVDLFGKILSLKIDKSSGNQAFDDLVLKQIKAAEPFPDFPDDSARTQKIYMKFNPQSID